MKSVEQARAHHVNRAVLAGAVERHEQADALVGVQVQVGMEEVGIAAHGR